VLIRISGGAGGIAEYLEHGRKEGREAQREQLDERFVLAGNLGIADAIIDRMGGEVDRYLHVTLAFKEDEVPTEVLEAVTRDFEAFAMAAYDKDEYCFYAEAHIPRIKSYTDQRSGEFVERKPHIHIVIPKLNLLSGRKLEPFGAVDRNIVSIDAFQEHTNLKYGLASPKDHRRIQFSDQSEIISRHKGDLFAGSGRALKEQVIAAVLDRGVEDYSVFGQLLAEFGEVTTRNAGRPTEYLNVKVSGQSKGTNLKDFVFTREFIELPASEKRARIGSAITQKYETAGDGRTTPESIAEVLAQWLRETARKVKYIN
jgi:hypothetical protein